VVITITFGVIDESRVTDIDNIKYLSTNINYVGGRHKHQNEIRKKSRIVQKRQNRKYLCATVNRYSI